MPTLLSLQNTYSKIVNVSQKLNSQQFCLVLNVVRTYLCVNTATILEVLPVGNAVLNLDFVLIYDNTAKKLPLFLMDTKI